MASITASGVGSGLDVNSIISQLMAVERAPIDRLDKRVVSYQTQLSAYGKISSQLSALQTAAEAIGKTNKFDVFKASVGDSSVLGATVGSGATAGSYSVEVQQLAQANKLASSGFSSSTATVATGTLTIDLGQLSGSTYTPDASKTLSITIDSTNNTLEGVRDAINAAKGGVTATIIDDGSANPARLVITANDSGTANTIRMSGIAGLDYDPATATGSMQQTVAAKDANLTIDGIAVTRSSNTVTDAIAGVTLSLTKTNTGTPTTVSVEQDTDSIKANIQAFVKAYNDLNSTIRTSTAYDATTKTAGTLNGDSTARQISDRLRTLVDGDVAGSPGGFSRLSDVGITLQKDGSLAIDSAKLDQALQDPSKDISGLFGDVSGTNGIAAVVAKEAKSMLGTDGLLTSRTDGINTSIKHLNDQRDALEERMTQIETAYRKQYTALDAMMSSMNATSQFLAQQLTKLS